MIPRYSPPEMVAIWSPETRYSIWVEIETLAAEAMAELGMIPANVPKAVRERGAHDRGSCRRVDGSRSRNRPVGRGRFGG